VDGWLSAVVPDLEKLIGGKLRTFASFLKTSEQLSSDTVRGTRTRVAAGSTVRGAASGLFSEPGHERDLLQRQRSGRCVNRSNSAFTAPRNVSPINSAGPAWDANPFNGGSSKASTRTLRVQPLLLSRKLKTVVVVLLTIRGRGVFFLLIFRRKASNGGQAE
jgi:hypothetical protein